jgi:hypothetical protein
MTVTNDTTTWSWTTPATTEQASSTTPPQPVRTANPARALALKEINAGIVMIVIGVAITVGTFELRLPVFVVSWGPVVFGIRRVFRGMKLLAKA